jgi:peptidoglycan/LPS O-acetylase OafA/YrhL
MFWHWYVPYSNIPALSKIEYLHPILLFFVLSGFLITKIIFNFRERNQAKGISHSKSIRSFFIRRALRIFPVFYLTLGLLYITDYRSIKEYLPWFATYTSNYYMSFVGKDLDHGNHFWTLAVEEQFYLFWIFLMLFVSIKKLRETIIYTIVISVGLLTWFYMFPLFKYMNYWLICTLHPFALGALIAYYEKYQKDVFSKISLYKVKMMLLLLSVTFFGLYMWDDSWNDLIVTGFLGGFKEFWISTIYALVVLIAVKNGFKGIWKWILENKVSIYIGHISYGLYIYHNFMRSFFNDH